MVGGRGTGGGWLVLVEYKEGLSYATLSQLETLPCLIVIHEVKYNIQALYSTLLPLESCLLHFHLFSVYNQMFYLNSARADNFSEFCPVPLVLRYDYAKVG